MKPIRFANVTLPYGVKYSRFKGVHKGIDYQAHNSEVRATTAGTVIHAGTHKFGTGWGSAFGIHIVIDNVRFIDASPGLWSGYCHLSKVLVKPGQKVKKGDVIGISGNTGRSTGEHLHYEVQKRARWSRTGHVNPQKWVSA